MQFYQGKNTRMDKKRNEWSGYFAISFVLHKLSNELLTCYSNWNSELTHIVTRGHLKYCAELNSMHTAHTFEHIYQQYDSLFPSSRFLAHLKVKAAGKNARKQSYTSSTTSPKTASHRYTAVSCSCACVFIPLYVYAMRADAMLMC